MSELSELRETVNGMRADVARTATNVDWIRETVGHQVTRSDRQDERLGRVERRQWWLVGMFAAVLGALGIGGGVGLKP